MDYQPELSCARYWQLKDNSKKLEARIEAACHKHHRSRSTVSTVYVGKTFPPQDLFRVAYFAKKPVALGENYLQESLEKIEWFKTHQPDVRVAWHFLGSIQTNKAKLIAQNFDWVHSIDRVKVAERLSAARPFHLPPLQVLIEVNADGSSTKGGVLPNEVGLLAQKIVNLPQLILRGVMAIPDPNEDPLTRNMPYELMYRIYRALKQLYPTVDTLSMGMSSDLELAIEHGANMIRVGQAIYGPRAPKAPSIIHTQANAPAVDPQAPELAQMFSSSPKTHY